MAFYFELIYTGDLESWQRMCIGVLITSLAWVIGTFVTRPTDMKTLTSFYNMIGPHDIGWKPVINQSTLDDNNAIYQEGGALKKTNLSQEILMMFLGSIMIYSALFSTGYLLYGNYIGFIILAVVSIICLFSIVKIFK